MIRSASDHFMYIRRRIYSRIICAKKQKECAKAMLPFLHVAERDSWDHLVNGDE
jgi:hypothetical protein